MAHFAPESVVHFAPESVAHFAPELVAHFAPELVAHFAPEFSVKPLRDLQEHGATPEQVQNAANSLAKKYQNKRWFNHYYKAQSSKTGVSNPLNPLNNSFKSSTTGQQLTQTIGIRAYETTVTNIPIVAQRPTDGSLLTTVNTGVMAPPGATVNVNFDPFSVANGLSVNSLTPFGSVNLVSTGFIRNENGTSPFFSTSTIITTTYSGQIQYIIQNSTTSTSEDSWSLSIQVVNPPVLNPKPFIVNIPQ